MDVLWLFNNWYLCYSKYIHYFVESCNWGSLHRQKRASCRKSPIAKPISGCVRIACSGLMITSLLQVANRLAASCELHAGLMQVVSSTYSKSANIKLQQVWCSQTWCNLMKSTGLIQIVGKLHQAGKIHNLHQVCGVFGCVRLSRSWSTVSYRKQC